MKQENFLEIDGGLVVKPLRIGGGEMLGWCISRNGITLERNRGGVRTFKMLCSVAAFCRDHGIDSFVVEGV